MNKDLGCLPVGYYSQLDYCPAAGVALSSEVQMYLYKVWDKGSQEAGFTQPPRYIFVQLSTRHPAPERSEGAEVSKIHIRSCRVPA